jgi:transposase-like protein
MLVRYDKILTEENRKMARRNYTAEQIIIKLRKIELLCNQGNTIAEAVRQEEITEQTYYRWRKQYGGMNTSDAKKLKLLEKENARLKRIIANQALDIEILKDVNSKNF